MDDSRESEEILELDSDNDNKTDDNDIDHDHVQYKPKQPSPPQLPRCKLQFVFISKEWSETR